MINSLGKRNIKQSLYFDSTYILYPLLNSDRFDTRSAFMKKVVNQQKIANFPKVLNLIDQAEQLFRTIQILEKVVPLQEEEKLFIEVVMGWNNSHPSNESRVEEITEDEDQGKEEGTATDKEGNAQMIL